MMNRAELPRIIELLKNHKLHLRDRFGVRRLAVFGSYVRGEERRDSDIDILVDFEFPVSLLDFLKLESFLEELLQRKTDVVPLDDLRQEIKREVLKKAVFI